VLNAAANAISTKSLRRLSRVPPLSRGIVIFCILQRTQQSSPPYNEILRVRAARAGGLGIQ